MTFLSRLTRLTWPVVLVVFLIGLAISLQLGMLDIERHASEEHGRVVRELAEVRARLEGTIKATFNVTEGLVHLLALRGTIEPRLVDGMSRKLIETNPHIRNIAIAPDDRVAYVYPLAGNERVVGLRYATIPEQYGTVVRARESGHPLLAGPLNLVQGGRGVINRAPVFVEHKDGDKYWGMVSIVAYVDALLKHAGIDSEPSLRVAVRGKDGEGALGELIFGDARVFAAEPVTALVMVPGGTWQIGAVPKVGWAHRSLLDSYYFRLGLLNTLLVSVAAALLLRHGQALRALNQSLQRENSERRRVEAALREEEQRFRTLFESSPDPVWLIENHVFVACNNAAVRVLGYGGKEELAKVHPSLLSPPFQPDGEPSLDKAERMMAVARERGLNRFEWMHRRKDGSDFPVEVTLNPIALQGREVIHCVWRDITDRKRDEAALQLAATALKTTAEGVVITNARSEILSTNRAFTEITGYDEAEVIGRKISLLRSQRHDATFYAALWRALEEDGLWRGEIWNRRKNGEIYPEWLTITAIKDPAGVTRNYVGVFSDISSLKSSQEELQRLAHYDPLTGLPNRALFQDRLTRAIEAARRSGRKVAVLLMDLDGFKNVNDSLGHPVGDLLLTQVAARLGHCVRANDTVARLGGDEFALIVGELEEGDDAIGVVRKILAGIQEPYDLNGHGARVSASVGLAVFPCDGDNPTDLVRNADTAMYGAKESGRGTYRFYQAAMTERAQGRLELERALRRGIEAREFEIVFQPKVGLRGSRLTGAEALVRWRDPQRGLVPPNEFIPLAERTGLIVPLGALVLDLVCASAKRFQDAGLAFGRLAVNVSAPQIDRGDFPEVLGQALRKHGIAPECLEIEITESFIMASADDAREVVLAIQALGVTTAIDDFGTGYSSLAYLKQLPIDALKIDRAFVSGIPDDANDIAITRAIISMAHSLGFKLVAEGVETEAQRDFLIGEGCDEAQGWLFSRPLSPADFERWLREHQAVPKP